MKIPVGCFVFVEELLKLTLSLFENLKVQKRICQPTHKRINREDHAR